MEDAKERSEEDRKEVQWEQLLRGRFAAMGHKAGEAQLVLLESLPEMPNLVDLLAKCCSHEAKLLLPAEHRHIIPLISAAYDIVIAPLKVLVRSSSADVIPLPFSLNPSVSGPLQTLDSSTVRKVIQQLDPLCASLNTSQYVYPENDAIWLGLHHSETSSCFGGDNIVPSLHVAVGLSKCGHMWIYRSPEYFDWKKIVAVIQATLLVFGGRGIVPDMLVCAYAASDEVLSHALTSNHCCFTSPSNFSREDEVVFAIDDSNMDCITFRERIASEFTFARNESIPNLIFLLAGQSNMSGRGRLSDLIQDHSLDSVRATHNIQGQDTSPFVLENTTTANISEAGDICMQSVVRLSPSYARRVKAYNAKESAWIEMDPMTLHSQVDYVRDARFGPGVTFATHLIELMDEQGFDASNSVVTGLVPTAVGATFLEEWSSTFRLRDAKGTSKCRITSPAESIFLDIPENANYQPHANRGCHNLFSCAMRSFFVALVHVIVHKVVHDDHFKVDDFCITFVRKAIGGIVWSQGCNDSISVPESKKGALRYLGEFASKTYWRRQAEFMREIRWCMDGVVHLVYQYTLEVVRQVGNGHSPPPFLPVSNAIHQETDFKEKESSISWPPIVMVAVTATRPWMIHLSEIRRHQLAASAFTPNLLTVDSLGSPLKTDCVHLTTAAALSLGHLLAVAMVHLLRNNSSQFTCEQNSKQDSLLLSIADCATPRDLGLYHKFCKARAQCEDILNEYYNSMTKADRIDNKKKYPVFGTELKAVNFVYGEIHFQGILKILRYIDKHRLEKVNDVAASCSNTSCKRFVDLGCGAGVACAAAALAGSYSHVLGIELMISKMEACRCMMRCLEVGSDQKENEKDMKRSDLLQAAFKENGVYTTKKMTADENFLEKQVNIEMKVGNFLDGGTSSEHWVSWDVVYMACTMFAEDQMSVIFQKVLLMPSGSYLILLDKQLPNTTDSDDITKVTFDCFELIMSCQCKSSWGTTMAYIYHKYA